MKLESIEYIKSLEDERILDSQRASEVLDALQEHLKIDFGYSNRKLGKFLLSFKYPYDTEVIGENKNALDLNIFTVSEVVSKILTSGNADFLYTRP